MRIKEITFNEKKIPLCRATSPQSGNNVFTLIVGRNGSGKSSLFKKICQVNIQSILKKHPHQIEKDHTWDENASITFEFNDTTNKVSIRKPTFNQHASDINIQNENTRAFMLSDLQWQFNQSVEIENLSSQQSEHDDFTNIKIIAVSSSPFDKFPLIQPTFHSDHSKILNSHYFYRGARTGQFRQKDYLKSKFDQLGASFINVFLKNDNRNLELLPLFKYLGFSSKLVITLKTTDPIYMREIINLKEKSDPEEVVRKIRFFGGSKREAPKISSDEKKEIVSATGLLYGDTINPDTHRFKINLDIKQNNNNEVLPLKEYTTLTKFDLLELESIEFIKENTEETILLSDASSGELCILFNILSITAEITDNTVILIDEPELSLHPEWQLEFLPLLYETFSKYKNCHFIIATHSPQIVSSICESNSYIVNLESNPACIIDGQEVSKKSLDHQLVYIFRSPGNRNEYLISKTVELLTAISDGQDPDPAFIQEANELIALHEIIPTNDPMRKLLLTLKKAMSIITK